MLYGSWKFINKNRLNLLSYKELRNSLRVDLLTFCYADMCPFLPKECKKLTTSTGIDSNTRPSCYYIEENNQVDFDYPVLNSFIMFKRKDIRKLLKPYKYVLRTDVDVFLGPALWFTRPTRAIAVGNGAYCDSFNKKRLMSIARKLKMVHRGVHCVGSTWYGKRNILIYAANKTLSLTKYIYLNEFSSNLKGIEDIDFSGSQKYGVWKRWWKPVSLLYAAELTLNDMIPDFSNKYKMNLDTSSCSNKAAVKLIHIHCYHSKCEFQKFNFTDNLKAIMDTTSKVDSSVSRNLIKYSRDLDITKMDVSEYASYIAWNSVHKYMFKNGL